MPKKNQGVDAAKYDKSMGPGAAGGEGLVWRAPHARPFRLAGFAWFEQDRVYRRLPLKPPAPLPQPVNNLAWSTAGGQIQFRTDSRTIAVRVRLRGSAGMVHMPATGQCGFDLYHGPAGRQKFLTVTKYPIRATDYEQVLLQNVPTCLRNITLNFPLYQGVEEALVGLEPNAALKPPPAYALDRRIVIYGTSITQGGCAARPGMAYTNILSRRLNAEIVNLGFSGNGKGEPELARIIATVDRCGLFVLDYEANAQGLKGLRKTLPGFVRILRRKHPKTPILVVSMIRPAGTLIDANGKRAWTARRVYQRETVARLRKAGDRNIHFCDGSKFLTGDGLEGTVDGVHPTDLGFLAIANGLEPALRKILFS